MLRRACPMVPETETEIETETETETEADRRRDKCVAALMWKGHSCAHWPSTVSRRGGHRGAVWLFKIIHHERCVALLPRLRRRTVEVHANSMAQIVLQVPPCSLITSKASSTTTNILVTEILHGVTDDLVGWTDSLFNSKDISRSF